MKGRMKSFFGRKSPSGPASANNENEQTKVYFTHVVLKEMDKTQTVLHRARVLRELSDLVAGKDIEKHAIEAVWQTIADLFHPNTPVDGRHAAFEFLISLVKGQYEQLGIIRGQFFRFVVNHQVPEDLSYRVILFKWLTDNGKDISYYEQIGSFLDNFMSEALFSENTIEFLQFLVNVIRYNSSFLDKEVVCSLVKKTCDFCNVANDEKKIENCLSLLDATVKYGCLPSEGLFPLIVTLCRTVNIEDFSQTSWKLMRNLIGTKLGHTALYMMCCILEDNNNVTDLILLRGAIFFVGMCIWGSKRVHSLRFLPIHVLPAFKISLQCANPLVAHEVSISLQRLVKKFGFDQEIVTWGIMMDIIEILLKMLESSNRLETESLFSTVHAVLTNIEQLYTENKFHGSVKRFFGIIETCSKDRPEASIMNLLNYYKEEIDPSRDDWLEVLAHVLEKYLKTEKRTTVRIKGVNMISQLVAQYRYKYEEELLEVLLKEYIVSVAEETNEEVRLANSHLLSDLLQMCHSTKYPEVLAAIGKIISTIKHRRENLQDIEILVGALVRAYSEKVYTPTNNYFVLVFNIIVDHVTLHYLSNLAPLVGGGIRSRIFTTILNMRTNPRHYIGIAEKEGRVKYSAHAIFKSDVEEQAKVWSVHCDFQKAFDAILKCLKNELDWNVLEGVLKNLPYQLQNKSLFTFSNCNMNKLCATLCNLINDKMYLNTMQNCPPTLSISELRNLIFPILSVIATYHDCLSRERQYELVECLEYGLNTLCVRTCVTCLTICTLEMQHVMTRALPSVLVKLSQISATVTMAAPVLQFLSTLKEIPCLYVNFVEEQYMSIFAMALPYTDHKYSTYVVSVAHQVIADWFTRCRLVFRRGFVSLITKALKSNQFQSTAKSTKTGQQADQKIQFHKDMAEVCLDMMARYSFSHHLCQPKRSPIVDYLLDKGDLQTWIVSNMLITITTSCGTQESCQKCNRPNKAQPEKKKKHQSLSARSVMKSESASSKLHESAPVSYQQCTEPIPVVSASPTQRVEGEKESWCEEEGVEVEEPTPLVEKLTQQLQVQKTDVFSPSEQLMFSRQTSKICVNNSESEDDEDDEIPVDVLQFEEEDTVFDMKEKDDVPSVAPSTSYDIISQSSFPPNLSNSKEEGAPVEKKKVECTCINEGWAEILIRRSTGNVSWVMRIKNGLKPSANTVNDLALLASNLDGEKIQQAIDSRSPRRRYSHARRFSTGSIDTLRSKGSSYTDEYSTSVKDDIHPDLDVIKSPLEKSFSTPRYKSSPEKRDIDTYQSRLRAFSAVEHSPPVDHDVAARSESDRGTNNGISPYFVFLQLFYSPLGCFPEKIPILLEHNEVVERGIKLLDRLPPCNTHKFGVLYVDKGQEKNEVEILSNQFGSVRYTEFISGLGELVRLSDCEGNGVFTGGMDASGTDGRFAYTWKDDTTQVIFHIASMMPKKEQDVKCVAKKLHIGNNFVSIIYDESKHGYVFATIKGQMNFAEIWIRPLENLNNKVVVRVKQGCDGGVMGNQTYIISDRNLPILVRQLAIHTNIATGTQIGEGLTNAYTSNWLRRLLHIKRLKQKVCPGNDIDVADFIHYT